MKKLEVILKNAFNGDKQIDFISTSLRSALDIYKEGGHVTRVYRDQRFRLNFDGRREVIVPDDIRKGIYEGVLDWDGILLDSNPVKDPEQSRFYRSVSSLNKSVVYQKTTTAGSSSSKYKDRSELAYRNFIKAYYSGNFGIENEFPTIQSLIN